MSPEAIGVKPAAIGALITTPEPFHFAPVRVIGRIRIEVILTRNLTECLNAISAIRNHDIVTHLHISPERIGADNVPVKTTGIRVLLEFPFCENLAEFIKPLIRPIDISTPPEMDQIVIESKLDPVIFDMSSAKSYLENTCRTVQALCSTASPPIQPCTFTDPFKNAVMAFKAKAGAAVFRLRPSKVSLSVVGRSPSMNSS